MSFINQTKNQILLSWGRGQNKLHHKLLDGDGGRIEIDSVVDEYYLALETYEGIGKFCIKPRIDGWWHYLDGNYSLTRNGKDVILEQSSHAEDEETDHDAEYYEEEFLSFMGPAMYPSDGEESDGEESDGEELLPFFKINYKFDISDIEYITDKTRDVIQMRVWVKHYKDDPKVLAEIFASIINYRDMPIEILKVFIDEGFDINKARYEYHSAYEKPITPLEDTVWYGNNEMFLTLIKIGARVDDENLLKEITFADENSNYTNPTTTAKFREMVERYK